MQTPKGAPSTDLVVVVLMARGVVGRYEAATGGSFSFPHRESCHLLMGFVGCAIKGPSRDQEVFTWAAVVRNGQREVDGTRQHTNDFDVCSWHGETKESGKGAHGLRKQQLECDLRKFAACALDRKRAP